MCPVILSTHPLAVDKCFAIDKATLIPAVQPAIAFDVNSRFLIGNDLRIRESSSLKALKFLREQTIDLSGTEVEATRITAVHIRRILVGAFLGKADVLHFAFYENGSSDTSSE